MEPNPYEAPRGNAGRGFRDTAKLDFCGYASLALAAVLPLCIVWERVAAQSRLLPPPPMENWYFNVIFTVVVFLLTVLSVPLGIAGLFSRPKMLAAIGTTFGSANAIFIFFVKFYPVLVK
jgi:hypothetical protein